MNVGTVSDEALKEAYGVVAWRIENHVPQDLMRQLAECFDITGFCHISSPTKCFRDLHTFEVRRGGSFFRV